MNAHTSHQVNFIPAAVRSRAYRKQLIPWVATTFVFTVALVGASSYLLERVQQGLEKNISVREQELTKVSGDALEKEQSVLGQRLALAAERTKALNMLALSEADWNKVYEKVESLVPKDVKLTTYSATMTATGLQVKISGNAPSNLSMASFIEALKANKDLTRQSVDSYSYTPATGAVQFSMTLELPQSLILFRRAE